MPTRFKDTTEGERADLCTRLHKAIVNWLDAHDISAGSVAGSYSLYAAVDDAVEQEFVRAALPSEEKVRGD